MKSKPEDFIELFEELVGEAPTFTEERVSGTHLAISPLKNSSLWVEIRHDKRSQDPFASLSFFYSEEDAKSSRHKQIFGIWLVTWQMSCTSDGSEETREPDEIVLEFEMNNYTFLWDEPEGKLLRKVVSRFHQD